MKNTLMKITKKNRPTLDGASRIGIVNRGEAAIRFIRAVREYNSVYQTNLTTAVFYLDKESEALFVKEADIACPLSQLAAFAKNQGTAYLNRDLMLGALLSTHCQAVWVGWGFLAEDASFAQMIEEAKLVFIGPSSESMALLGDKISAKELAERAHVPVLPWSKGPVNDVEEASQVSARIGYPVIVKASNAGGGRGIRFVRKPEELTAQYLSAQEEAVRTTGSKVMFIEHLVVTGRHLEVQTLADRYGNVSTFGVRDCSVQRRNQKIIEETPPPHFDRQMMAEMEGAAVRLIREAEYEGAGTVEFLYDVDANQFYFMEVNTRLQVEHPITEQLYHIDLVKGQILVASGQRLDLIPAFSGTMAAGITAAGMAAAGATTTPGTTAEGTARAPHPAPLPKGEGDKGATTGAEIAAAGTAAPGTTSEGTAGAEIAAAGTTAAGTTAAGTTSAGTAAAGTSAAGIVEAASRELDNTSSRLETVSGVDGAEVAETLAKERIVPLSLCPPVTSVHGPAGVAIEVRLNAEDPDRDFTPAPGKVVLFKIPAGPGIRVDSGIEEGSVIPSEFDSMIAKIIAYAPDRSEALARLRRALREMRIKVEGGTSNRAFLLGLLDCPQVQQGGVNTRFVEDLLKSADPVIRRNRWDIALVASAIEQAIARYREELVNFKLQWSRIGQPRNISPSRRLEVTLHVHGHAYTFLVQTLGGNVFHLKIDGQFLNVQYHKRDHEAFLLYNNQRHTIQLVPRGDCLQCEVDGIPYAIEIESTDAIKAPFPAIVLSIAVTPGQVVHKGDIVLSLEAMKMVMNMEAPKSGIIKALCIREGEQVATGQPLIQMDTSDQNRIALNGLPLPQELPVPLSPQGRGQGEGHSLAKEKPEQPRIYFAPPAAADQYAGWTPARPAYSLSGTMVADDQYAGGPQQIPATAGRCVSTSDDTAFSIGGGIGSISSTGDDEASPSRLPGKCDLWQIMVREFLAVFLGYDYDHETHAIYILKRMLDFVKENPTLEQEIIKSFLAVLEIYTAVENLFSHQRIETDGFAGATNYQELLMHFFIRNECRKEGLPQQFLDSLKRAIIWYPQEGLPEEEGFNQAMFRIYKSHANLKVKQEVLRAVLLSMKDLPQIKAYSQKVSGLLDEIAKITLNQMPSLSEAAIQARYHTLDSIFLEDMKRERRAELEELARLTQNPDEDPDNDRQGQLSDDDRNRPDDDRNRPGDNRNRPDDDRNRPDDDRNRPDDDRNRPDDDRNRQLPDNNRQGRSVIIQPPAPATLIQDIVNTGHYIVFDLVRVALGTDKEKGKLALELLGRYFNRDRDFISGDIREKNGLLLYHQCSARKGETYETLVAVVDERTCAKKLEEIQNYLNEEAEGTEGGTKPELIVLISVHGHSPLSTSAGGRGQGDGRSFEAAREEHREERREEQKEEQKEEALIQHLYRQTLPVCWCCLGLLYKHSVSSYHTFVIDQEQKWQEDFLRRSFSPLFYRELKVYLLANFNLEILYSNESLYLVSATAKNNPKDQRLFALVEVSESRAEVSEDNSIQRIVAFDHALMEAIYAMSAKQSKYKHGLFLNRIIIYVHSVLTVNLRQIKDYASRLASRARELGLEKAIIFTHRAKVAGRDIPALEIHFKNVSQDHFVMDYFPPSTQLLEPMTDTYVSKVVMARLRGTVYPYEIIKMITHLELGGSMEDPVEDPTGDAGGDPARKIASSAGRSLTGSYPAGSFPAGNFEEFDIRTNDETGAQEPFSVKARPHGQNVGNIVLGIITNYTRKHPYGLQRVIILVDTTSDMGSLAEHECLRIIGALDLAQKRQLPVEWLPISGGAKIDMNSGTENLDWTARVLKRIIEFTQAGGEINMIVSGVNVGAQSYWNAEATMLMHTKGILIMTEDASMLLTGKRALDFSGSVSAEDNIGIGGVEKIMGPNGQAQIKVKNLSEAYTVLFQHYNFTYKAPGKDFPKRQTTTDKLDRDICRSPYKDHLDQGFSCIGDIFSQKCNPERKKPFEMRQVMLAVVDQDAGFVERWQIMQDAETAIVWETRVGGYAVGMLGIESRPLARLGKIPHDGPESWSGGTLFPQSSKKLARAINAFSQRLPLVILANLSGFDGSPESLRKLQLEYGAEIGRAVVNFKGPIIFVVVARYHGGAYVVFSRSLNPFLHSVALEGTFASVIGGAPAAAVVFHRKVLKDTYSDPRIIEAQNHPKKGNGFKQKEFDELFQKVQAEKQTALGQQFDQIHSVERAKKVGSIDNIISPVQLRPYLIKAIEDGMAKWHSQSMNTVSF
jgi:acetyl/propionyl-CoA carboxylase alpha subunit/acetyl-CoA carboxylase carboxyltransferase component